jgi:hypothetical protein
MNSPALSKASINALMQMAVDRSSSGRGALARSVANICLVQNHNLSEKEVQLTFDILHTLIHDVEMRVRRDLARQLAPRRDVLRDLIVTLANDQIDVADPVLVESVVLEDDDLIAVIRERSAKHQIAISLRKPLSAAVSAVLFDTKNLDVIDSLTRNSAAALSEVTLRRLVEMSSNLPPLCGPLLHRPDMSPEMARGMSGWVDDGLKDFIAKTFPEQDVAAGVLEDGAAGVVEDGAAGVVEDGAAGVVEDGAAGVAEDAAAGVAEDAAAGVAEDAAAGVAEDAAAGIPDDGAARVPGDNMMHVAQSGAEYAIDDDAEFEGMVDPRISDAIRDALRIADGTSPHDLWERVEDIEMTSGITAGVMIQSLRDKDIELFEALFARLSRLDMAAMLVTIYDPGSESFATVCKAHKFSQSDFEQLHLLLMATLVGDGYAETQAFQTIRAFYNRLDGTAASAALAEWQRTPPTAWKT